MSLNINEEINEIIEHLKKRKQQLVKEVSEEFNELENMEENMDELLTLTVKAFEKKEGNAEEHALKFGNNLGLTWLEARDLDVGIRQVYEVRRSIWRNLKQIMLELEVHLETSLIIADIFDEINDKIIQAYSTAYIASYKENLDKKEEEFLTLSAPVVPILEGMAILPIVGGIDESRAERLMRNALYEANQRELDYLFIDLSGVSYIDTMIAYHIFKIVDSLELIGVKTVLSGIRPEVSHTMVSLGIDFKKIKTYSTLQQALPVFIHL
ncbi:STAS domain-containing protein [Oceanobacillus damuensis]|uniref:STAS domain-containing protein n=1 Tax=Oceanobacillus damuensis TaxID=937928 RepID=UPI00083710FC|nr:STAS domain-containing protein [Oceanobacillus damuensis]